MPPELSGKYQYFTQADMGALQTAGYPVSGMHALKTGIADYVRNYLDAADMYL